jgi:hypothetical protein
VQTNIQSGFGSNNPSGGPEPNGPPRGPGLEPGSPNLNREEEATRIRLRWANWLEDGLNRELASRGQYANPNVTIRDLSIHVGMDRNTSLPGTTDADRYFNSYRNLHPDAFVQNNHPGSTLARNLINHMRR